MQRLSYVMVGAAWFVASLGAGMFLVHRTSVEVRDGELLQRTQHVADLLVDMIGDRQRVQQTLEGAEHFEPGLQYAMVWKPDGNVLAHTTPEVVGQFLDAERWPALESNRRVRIATMDVQEWAVTGKQGRVLEITVALRPGDVGAPLLSMAYPDDAWIDPPHLAEVVAFAAGSMGLILAGTFVARGRFERARREIVQEARARTSLLTGEDAGIGAAHEIRSPLTAAAVLICIFCNRGSAAHRGMPGGRFG